MLLLTLPSLTAILVVTLGSSPSLTWLTPLSHLDHPPLSPGSPPSLTWLTPLSHLVSHLHYKLLINVLLGSTRLEVWGLEKSEEELIHNLKVGPRGFQCWFVFFWVKFSTRRVRGRRKGTESIFGKLHVAGMYMEV